MVVNPSERDYRCDPIVTADDGRVRKNVTAVESQVSIAISISFNPITYYGMILRRWRILR